MAIDRPTFHEAWYRVAELRPRLLSGVRVYRQYFRGQLWYVLENPTNGQYSRVSEEAYRFIGHPAAGATPRHEHSLCGVAGG